MNVNHRAIVLLYLLSLAIPVCLAQSNFQASAQDAKIEGSAESTTLRSQAASDLLRSGTESTTIQGGTQSTTLKGGAEGAKIEGQVERENGPVNILFLIDSSQSMKEKLGGGIPKMEAAKQVLEQAISNIPGDVNIGLRVFGQHFSDDPMIDCQQTALLVPLATGNRRSIIEATRQLKPYGMTPLAWALMQSARDLRVMQGPKTLILISDGAETCGGDPCGYIGRLAAIGINVKVDIVGLGLKRDKEAREQLNCIANASGGKYYDADSAEQLIDSVSRSVSKAIEGRVLTKTPGVNLMTPPDMVPIEPQGGGH